MLAGSSSVRAILETANELARYSLSVGSGWVGSYVWRNSTAPNAANRFASPGSAVRMDQVIARARTLSRFQAQLVSHPGTGESKSDDTSDQDRKSTRLNSSH